MITFKEMMEAKKTGSYIGVKFSKESNDKIFEFMKDINIPNMVNRDDFHSTIIYSKKNLKMNFGEKMALK